MVNVSATSEKVGGHPMDLLYPDNLPQRMLNPSKYHIFTLLFRSLSLLTSSPTLQRQC
jgi:hypothetical protein